MLRMDDALKDAHSQLLEKDKVSYMETVALCFLHNVMGL